MLRHSVRHFPHCVLNGRTQRRALPCYQSEKILINNNWYLRKGIEPTTVTPHTCATTPRRSQKSFFLIFYFSGVFLELKEQCLTKFFPTRQKIYDALKIVNMVFPLGKMFITFKYFSISGHRVQVIKQQCTVLQSRLSYNYKFKQSV